MELQGRELRVNTRGADVKLLHEELRKLGYTDIPQEEVSDQRFGAGTSRAVRDFQERHGLEPTAVVDAATAARINAEVDKVTFTVDGKVVSRSRAGVGGLRVEIVDKNVGDDVRLAETTTDDSGGYRTTFTISDLGQRGKDKPDLQARVFTVEKFLGASDVRYNASDRETLNVLLTDKTDSDLASEHETLLRALSGRNLRNLQETDGQRDITYLANKTGWDARAVALAALADQFSARAADAAGGITIEPGFFYGLFRAGVPANERVYQISAKAATAIWTQGIDQGVIPAALRDRIPQVLEQFQRLAVRQAVDGPALAGVSPLKEMLSVSLGDDPARQQRFADLYVRHRDDPPRLWESVRSTFGEAVERRLRVDGQLGYLTLNNVPLIKKLHAARGEGGLANTLELVEEGYYRAEKWQETIGDDPVPPEIPGEGAEKRTRYAELMAAQVRLSYPTATVAQMIRTGELPLTGAPQGVVDQVHTFLTEHQGKFEIGLQPVEQYIRKNNLQVPSETVKQVKRLHRLYQITASDQALIGLSKRGIDGAYHVVRYDKDTFVQSFAADLGGDDEAALTYDRSVQVHNAVLNIALGYLTARTAPAIGGHSPANVLDPAPAHAGDVIAYATLENLFGSMDFCACEHCRSILSPAAYLVDLLLFLDQPNPPAGTENPQTVLLERRPDIEHLPLTCENTNTVLPYIDVVNETLEYFIANDVQKLSLNEYDGHDTGTAASADLLASPQFVMDAAYTTLRGERFPVQLPFHQPLEALRRYFSKFEVPLPLAMERLRKSDDLERESNPYGWRDILMEEISLSRDEYEILTDSSAVPLWRMYGFSTGTADADVVAGLSNAKEFARRVGITYEDLISVLKTRFINPNSDLIPKLERLGVSFGTLKALKDGAITDVYFDGLLPTGLTAPDPAEYGGDIKAWVKDNDNYARIMGLITLAIPADTWAASTAHDIGDLVRPTAPEPDSTLYYKCMKPGTSGALEPDWPTTSGEQAILDNTVEWIYRDAASCVSFEDLAFRYSDPAKLTQDIGMVEFVRVLRFIRSWKKLGWTIAQTDAAICGLYRADLAPLDAGDIDTVAKLDAGFLTLLPRLGVVIKAMRALNLTPKRDLPSLLACWSEIDTHGDTALYRQMFLNPALLTQDAVFADNGYGEFLADTTQKLDDHAEAVRSAFNLTSDEYAQIVAALGYDADKALTLSNVSPIYPRGWLSRKLKLSVRELLLLIQLTGLDPFALPDPTNPAILRLVWLVQALKDRSLKSAAALYLIWNQDLSGKSAPDPAQVASFARTLRLVFAAVETEFAVTDDPDGAIAQDQMAKVYGADAATFFFGLLNDTLTVDVGFSDLDGTLAPSPTREAIENAAGKTDTGIPRIAYDDFRKRLSFSGVLTTATRDAIESAAGVGAVAFKTAVDNLYDENQAVINPFFARYPELQPAYDAYVADTAHSAVEKRKDLLKAILPELVQRRKRQQALQSVSALATADLAFTQAFLDTPAAPFPMHAFGHADRPALNDLLGLETPGLSVQFFASDTASGTAIPAPAVAANLDYAPAVGGIGNPLPANPTPGAAISGVWRGYLEVPENGFFNLRIKADVGATVTLLLDDKPVTPTQTATPWVNADPIELRAGTLYPIKLTVEKVRDVVRVQWEWKPKGQGRVVIPARYLYPAEPFEAFKETYVRFLKVASLATGLGLTANELAYFATHSDYHINADGWLNVLSVSGDPPPDIASALLKPFEALLDFARVKAEISPGDESLLTVLKEPATSTQNADSLLLTITRWNQTSLNDVLGHFSGSTAGLEHFDLFRRVYDAFALVQKMGVSANALMQATSNEPTGDTVRNFQAALRARYDADSWRDVVRPINDEMRSLQRDALVAYILHQMRSHPESAHIDTSDKLFEYFLMDVQMDPCMQTSRIRHALSSVQLFIERCLMNLEPRVSPAAITAKQWEWMKRYRVWEANRKVFLWPENWLEPELRDDQSPFFKETMSELLQSDITEDRAAVALLNYLSKLEEVAKLEPCGIYHVEGDPSIDHVVARTASGNRNYYYRRRDTSGWTPWEQIKLDIGDSPVVPVIWNNRLFLFWLKILKEPASTEPNVPPGETVAEVNQELDQVTPRVSVKAILCWSEYYNGKWQPTKTSDVTRPVELGTRDPADVEFSSLRISVFAEGSALRISISGGADFGSSFLLYNTHSLPEPGEAKTAVNEPLEPFDTNRIVWTSNEVLEIDYVWIGYQATHSFVLLLLKSDIDGHDVEPLHSLQSHWKAPFFHGDSRYVFYVTTEVTVVPVSAWDDFGVATTLEASVSQIPSLVLEEAIKVQPKPEPDPFMKMAINRTDRTAIQRYVTEDAYINKAIGKVGTIAYDGVEIGMRGRLSDET